MKIVKDSLTFSSTRYVLTGLSALRNFALAKVLDPENYGYWVVLSLVLAYGDQVHLGLRHAGERDIPFLKGRGQDDEAARVARVLYSGILLFSALVFLGLSLTELSGIIRLGELRHVLLLAGLIVAGEQTTRFSYMIIRTRQEFVLSSKLEIAFELMRTVAVCGLALWQGIHGALIGFLVTTAANIIYVGVVLRLPPRPLLDMPRMKALLKTSFLLFAVALVQLLLFNMDRVVGAFALSTTDLGMYGLAALVAQVPVVFSQSVSTVFVPSASEAFGRRNAPADVADLFLRFLRATAFAGPAVCASLLIVSKPMIRSLLADYALSVPVLTILLPGVMFALLIPPASALLVVTRKVPFLLVLEILGVVGAAALFWSTFAFTEGLQALSTGMVAAAIWHSSLTLMGALQSFGFSAGRLAQEVFYSYMPSVYAIIALFGIFPLLLNDEGDIQSALIELTVFMLVYAPVLLWGYRVIQRRPSGSSTESRTG